MTHYKTYIAGALCLILGMTSTLYAHNIDNILWGDRDHKHHYRLDGTLERADFYHEETGKLWLRYYYRADGETEERWEGYDRTTGKLRLQFYYRADGTKERADFYDEETGKVEGREYYLADETLVRADVYDIRTGKVRLRQYYDPTGENVIRTEYPNE